MKKVLSLVLVLTLVLGSFSFAFAAEPTDNEKVNALIELGLVYGDASGYRLNDTITRAEAAAMVVRTLDLESVAQASKYASSFKDVASNHWALGYINVAAGRGIVNGYPDGTFKPDANISYAEIITMMVQVLGGLNEQEAKAPWPANYITKASELGILKDVAIANFAEVAVREKVFEIVYNTRFSEKTGIYQIVKAIVLENYRVESIDKTDIVVEVIREVQKGDFAEQSRKEKGDQIKIELPAKIGDVEDLLGKVVDFSFDKNGNVVKAEIDNSYKYLVGSIKVKDDTLTLNSRDEYTVRKAERYNDSDERVFRTYYNNKAMTYANFESKYGSAEFARVTVKNGKVLFVDAFDFKDIAPVKEVKNDGKVVYIYDDNNDGLEKKLSFDSKTKVVLIKNKVMNVASLEDIEELDVIHYNTDANTVFVRKDAKLTGTYEKYSTGSVDGAARIFIYVDGNEYDTRFTPSRKAVWSMDGVEFETLERNEVSSKLEKMRKLDVTLLLDMNNRVQYISAAEKDSSFVALVDNILARSVKFQKADGEAVVLDATMDTYVTIEESTTTRNLSALRAGDLVRVWASDEEIVEVELITAEADMTEEDYTRFNSTYIVVEGEELLLDRNVKVFVDLVHSPYTRKGISIADFLKAYKGYDDGKVLGEVFVVTKDGVVTEIVFKSITSVSTATLPAATVKVLDIYGYGTRDLYEIEFERTNGDVETRKIAKSKLVDADGNKIEAGDIVSIVLQNTEDKNVHSVKQLIDTDAVVYEVMSIDSANRVVLKGKTATSNPIPMLRSAAQFGYVTRTEFVSVSINANGMIDAVDVRDDVYYEIGDEFAKPAVDKTALVAEVANAVAIDTTNYTAETVAALNAAVAAANTVVANAEATQEEVDAALAALTAAIEALVEKPVVTANVTYNTLSFGPSTIYVITLNSVEGLDVTHYVAGEMTKVAVGAELQVPTTGTSLTVQLFNGETEVGTIELAPVAVETTVDVVVTAK